MRANVNFPINKISSSLIFMANVIKIKKGLDIRLAGEAPKVDISAHMGDTFGVVPDNFHGFKPRLSVQVGDKVLAGSPVLQDKNHPELLLTSPVSGEVVDVVRGAKRKILYVQIKADATQEYKSFDTKGEAVSTREKVLSLLLESGLFALMKQRPYEMVADPTVTPRDIFVTANFTAPLMPNALELINEDVRHLQLAVDALAKLTTGKVYVGVHAGDDLKLNNAEVYEINGPHPAGNVSVLINHTKPINKGEKVWTLSVSELALIGRFLATGKVDYSHRIVIAGTRLNTAGYTRVIGGAEIQPILADKFDSKTTARRVIDGDVLTGKEVAGDYRFLSPFSNIITVIPDGSDVADVFGWLTPGFNKYSVSRSFPTFLTGKRTYDIDARLQGGERAIIVSNEYDKVFPMNIFPEQLVKSIIAFDIDRMEELGIYEVAPEDFALAEFVDTSKLELQYIVRKGLDELYKEMN